MGVGNKRPFLHASESFAGIKHVVSIVLDVVRFHKMFVKCTNKLEGNDCLQYLLLRNVLAVDHQIFRSLYVSGKLPS